MCEFCETDWQANFDSLNPEDGGALEVAEFLVDAIKSGEVNGLFIVASKANKDCLGRVAGNFVPRTLHWAAANMLSECRDVALDQFRARKTAN